LHPAPINQGHGINPSREGFIVETLTFLSCPIQYKNLPGGELYEAWFPENFHIPWSAVSCFYRSIHIISIETSRADGTLYGWAYDFSLGGFLAPGSAYH
jgi:hypothetical protein